MTDELAPLRLRLDPLMTIVRDGDDACQIVTSERQLFRIRGKTVPVLIEHVLPLLDGSRRVTDLRIALDGRVKQALLDDLLRLLMHNRVVRDVTDAPPLSEAVRETWRGALQLLSRFSARPEELFGQLRKARVAVVGDSPWVQDLVDALAAWGIGELDVIGRPPRDVRAPAGTQVHTQPWPQLASTVERADLVVGLQDGDFAAIAELKAVNRACLQIGRSWLHVRLTLDAEAWLGPLHAPGGACFECLGLRINSNLKAGREAAVAQRQAEHGQMVTRRLDFGPFRQQAAAMAAMEAVKHLTWIEISQLFSRCCLVDLVSQDTSLHTVLRHPGCPACGPAAERRLYPWDADEVMLERTLIVPRGAELA